jgi:hypothetical protein
MNDITYRQGLRTKGFQVTVPTTGTQQTLSLSGLAKSFEGIILSATTSAAPSVLIDPLQLKISLTINNDLALMMIQRINMLQDRAALLVDGLTLSLFREG